MGVAALAMFDALGQAHVTAYHALRDVYAARGWPAPDVSTNTSAIARPYTITVLSETGNTVSALVEAE